MGSGRTTLEYWVTKPTSTIRYPNNQQHTHLSMFDIGENFLFLSLFKVSWIVFSISTVFNAVRFQGFDGLGDISPGFHVANKESGATVITGTPSLNTTCWFYMQSQLNIPCEVLSTRWVNFHLLVENIFNPWLTLVMKTSQSWVVSVFSRKLKLQFDWTYVLP